MEKFITLDQLENIPVPSQEKLNEKSLSCTDPNKARDYPINSFKFIKTNIWSNFKAGHAIIIVL